MSIVLSEIECPACGAPIEVNNCSSVAKCSYCEKRFFVDNLTNNNKSETIEKENSELKPEKEEPKDNKQNTKTVDNYSSKSEEVVDTLPNPMLVKLWIFLSFVLGIITLMLLVSNDDLKTVFFILVDLPFIVGGFYYLFIKIPEKKEAEAKERQLILNGAIKFPSDLFPVTDLDVYNVKARLTHAGFTNVKTDSLHDVIIGLLQKPGIVNSIIVNGETINSGGKLYLPDVPILITYHGK